MPKKPTWGSRSSLERSELTVSGSRVKIFIFFLHFLKAAMGKNIIMILDDICDMIVAVQCEDLDKKIYLLFRKNKTDVI